MNTVRQEYKAYHTLQHELTNGSFNRSMDDSQQSTYFSNDLDWPPFLPDPDAFERFKQQLQQQQGNMTEEESVPWIQYQPPIESHSMKEVVIEKDRIPHAPLSYLLDESFPVREGDSFNGSEEEFRQRPSIRINWPGYEPYSKQVYVRDSTPQHSYVSVRKVLKEIAKVFRCFMEECRPLRDGNVEDKWRLHGPDAIIKLENVKITRVYKVARGSIQAEFAVIRKKF